MSAGYEFVRLPPKLQRRPRPNAVWHKRYQGTFSGLLGVTFRAEQAVHIGSGHKRMEDSKVLRTAVRIQGGPGIPGSSLKGVLRSRYEAITMSCVQQKPVSRASVRSASRKDIEQAKLTKSALAEAAFRGRCNDNDEESCPACALFGCTSLRSRVTVRDFACSAGVAFIVKPIHQQFGPNLHHVGQASAVSGSASESGKDYFAVRRLYGRKFAVGMGPVAESGELQWIEVIPASSQIAGTIALFNALPAELGGLLAALGHMPAGVPAGALKIGGGKGRGFGRLRLAGSIQYDLRDHRARPITVDQATEDGWRKAFESSEDRWATGEERLQAIHQGDC